MRLGVVMMLMVMDLVAADYQVFSVGTGNLPKIDGSIVVWDESVINPNGGDILWRDLSDVQGSPQRIAQAANQKTPAISGTMIVWQDYRNESTTGWDIYGWDLLTPTSSVFPICTAMTSQQTPAISGNRFVWVDRRISNTMQVYTTTLPATGGEVIAATTATQAEPAISGSIVVWRDSRDSMNQIYKCDLSVTPLQADPVYPAGTNQWRPAISGNRVLWEDFSVSNNITLVVFDYVQNQIVWTHTVTGSGINLKGRISGNLVVWQRPGTTNSDIRGYDLGTGQYLDISVGSEDDQNPAVSGRTVVWQRGNQIVGTTIPSPTEVAITAPTAGAVLLAGSEIQVAWSLVSGDAPAAVDIQFSPDGGPVWQTLTAGVPFADGMAVCSLPEEADSQNGTIQLVDAVSKAPLPSPGAAFTVYQCDGRLTADITGDCVVNMADLAEMSAQWLRCGNPYDAACAWE